MLLRKILLYFIVLNSLTVYNTFSKKETQKTIPKLNSNCNNFGTADYQDYDCDGVINEIDLDDDNDGILDDIEDGIICSEDFVSNFVLSGSAQNQTHDPSLSNNEIRLTPDLMSQTGAATFNQKINMLQDFSLNLKGYFGVEDNNGADGIALIFHNDPNGYSALGTLGGGLGALGIRDGIVVEFDDYFNGNVYDIPEDHTCIWDSDGPQASANIIAPIALNNIEDGAYHDIEILWTALSNNLQVHFNGGLVINLTNDLITNYFNGATEVYFGVSAATGGSTNEQKLKFECLSPPPNDTDNDGIKNSLDLDSDGDGCPDAIEGGDNFTATDLVTSTIPEGNSGVDYEGYSTIGVQDNLGNNVNAYGIPIIAGNGQDENTSQIGALLTITNTPEDFSTCTDAIPNLIEFSTILTAQPESAIINYEWQVSTNNGATFSSSIQNANGVTFGTLSSGDDTTLSLSNVDYTYNGNIYKIIFTTPNNSCPEEADATLIINPLPIANAGVDFTISCTNNTSGKEIGTTTTTGYTYAWTPNTGLSNSTISNPIANPTETTTYQLTVTNETNGCTNTDSVKITVDTSETIAEAGNDQIIDCNTTSVTIGTTPTSQYSYAWSPQTGLSDATISNPIASPTETTTYQLTVTNETNGCTGTDLVEITVDTSETIAEAGNDQIIDCNTNSVTIGTTPTSQYSYAWSPQTGLSNSTIANPTARPTVTTTYQLTVTNETNGCTSIDSVEIKVNTTAPVADAGNDQIIDCNTTSVIIGTTPINGYSYAWSPQTGLSDATIANPIASPTETTTYQLTVTDNINGCISNDSVNITVNTTTPVAEAGNDEIIDCNITSVTIGTEPTNGYSYSWSPQTGLSDATIANPIASPTETTTYQVIVTENINGCTSDDSVNITVNTTIPTADAGNDQVVNCSTPNVPIGTAPINGYSYSWSPQTGLSDPTVANPIASPTITTTYQVTVIDNTNGCTNTDSVEIIVVNTFPNADAGSDKTIDCNTTSVIIGTTPTNGYSYSWSPQTGLSDTTIANPEASPAFTTTYQVIVTDYTNGCISYDTVEISVNTSTPNANAGEDKIIDCNTTSVSIGTDSTPGYTYSWSPTTGLSDSTISNPTANPTTTTTYTIEVTDTTNGCNAIDSIQVNVAPPHAPSITAPDAIYLEGCSVNSSTVTAENSGFEYSESLITLTPSQVSTFLTFNNASFSEYCDYYITYSDILQDNTCPKIVLRTYTITNSYGESDTDTQQIIITDNTPPTFLQSVEPSIYVVCNPIPEPQVLAAIDNCTTIPDVIFSAQTTTIDDENYIIERTWIASDECNNQTSVTQFVYVKETNETINNVLNLCVSDRTINLNDVFENTSLDTETSPWIIHETNTETSYLFSPSEFGVGNYTLSSTTFRNNCTLERRVTIRIHDECLEVLCISSADVVSISTLVTPNGDNKNDTFTIDTPIDTDNEGPCNISIDLEIYNRWGALVYKSANYRNDWSGESPREAFGNEENLPQSTYYYIIKLINSGLKPIQGYFLLGKTSRN